MSMPNIPDYDITREQSINILLASIGMEELSLAHLMNAEGEKIQLALGTLPGSHKPLSPCEIMEINDNARRMLRDLLKTELLLTMKLESASELCKPQIHCPPPKDAHDCKGDVDHD